MSDTHHDDHGDGGHSNLEFQKPQTSLLHAIGIALCVATLPAAFIWFLLRHAPFYVSVSVFLITLGVVAGLLVLTMFDDYEVKPRYTAISTFLDGPTDTLLGVGTHKRLRYLQGGIDVYLAEKDFNPPAFEQLARDQVPVWVDGYFTGKIIDPILWNAEGGPDKEQLLMQSFDSEMRLFINQWGTAVALILMRDLLADFLQLPCREEDDEEGYRKLRTKLGALTQGADAPLTPSAVENIFEAAGNFCSDASKWGYEITKIHTENVDLPQAIKDAASKAASEGSLMKDKQIQNAARVAMAKELMDELKIDGNDALTSIDMLLDLAVKRDITEVHIRDLAKLVENPELATALATAFNRFMSKGGGNVRDRK